MFHYYWKRCVKGAVFWGCVLILTAIMVIGCYPSDLAYAKDNTMPVIYCFIVTNSIGISHVLLPVLAAVPFLFYYVEECVNGGAFYQMIRGSILTCCVGRLGASVVISMMLTGIATVLFTLICLLFGAGGTANSSMISFFQNQYFESAIKDRIWIVYGIYCLAFCLYAIPWGLVGMIVSLFTNNKYLIFASPFILFIIISYVTEAMRLFLLNPGSTLLKGSVRGFFGGGILHALVYHLITVSVLSVVYLYLFRRGIHNDRM